MSDKSNPNENEPETTGHEWDGIREYNNPLPRWWVWIFYATIIWGLGYTIAYPAWPLIERATPGLLGFSTRALVAEDIAAVEEANAALKAQLAEVDLAALGENEELASFAVNAGASVYLANCSQCHGSGAAGAEGFPNLLDDAWLWGGTIEEIAYTVTHGIRNEQSFDAHWSEMPAFGRDEILTDEEIGQVVQHVLAISGQEHDATAAEAGAQLYLDQCASCHMEDGEGNTLLGAPALNDAIWLYGGDAETITESVQASRFGVMPAWSEEFRPSSGLDQAEINAVAAYVHQLGGGQ